MALLDPHRRAAEEAARALGVGLQRRAHGAGPRRWVDLAVGGLPARLAESDAGHDPHVRSLHADTLDLTIGLPADWPRLVVTAVQPGAARASLTGDAGFDASYDVTEGSPLLTPGLRSALVAEGVGALRAHTVVALTLPGAQHLTPDTAARLVRAADAMLTAARTSGMPVGNREVWCPETGRYGVAEGPTLLRVAAGPGPAPLAYP